MSMYIETMQESVPSKRAKILLSCGPSQVVGVGKIGYGLVKLMGSGFGYLAGRVQTIRAPLDEGALIPRYATDAVIAPLQERLVSIQNRQLSESGLQDLTDGFTLLVPFVGYLKYSDDCDARSLKEYQARCMTQEEIIELQIRINSLRSRL